MYLKLEGVLSRGEDPEGSVLGGGRLEVWVCVGEISWRGVYKCGLGVQG